MQEHHVGMLGAYPVGGDPDRVTIVAIESGREGDLRSRPQQDLIVGPLARPKSLW